MRRREFITLIGGAAAAWPLVARAQQPDGVRRIGILMAYSATRFTSATGSPRYETQRATPH
jgi:putative tryptophan/tyrosine transport system substrate-binding protein